MAKDTDSDEDEIWNYKSATKGRAELTRQVNGQERVSRSTSIKLRTSRPSQKNNPQKYKTRIQSSSEKLKAGICAGIIKKNDEVIPAEIIVVDFENEFIASKVSETSSGENVFNKISQNNNSVKNDISVHVDSGSSKCEAILKCKPLSPNKKLSNTRMVRTKRAAVKTSTSTKGTTTPSPKKSDSVECHNIHKYFSPTSDKRKSKRKNSESVNNLFDFTDDELTFLGEENTGSVPKTGGIVRNKTLKVNSPQVCCSASNCESSTTSDSSMASIKSTQENVCLENVVPDPCHNPVSPKKVGNVCGIRGENNVISHGKADNPAASHEDGPNIVVANSEVSLDEHDGKTPYICCNTPEGGFFVDEDTSGLKSSIEDDKCRDKCEFQMSSSSSEGGGSTLSSMSSGCDINLAAVDTFHYVQSNPLSDISIAGTSAAQDKDDVKREISSVVQNDFPGPADTYLLLTTAQKQTSIFSFFKAKYGSSSKTSKSPNNKFSVSNLSRTTTLPNSLSKVTARPILHRGNIAPVAQASPSFTSRTYQKPWLQKSASVSSVGQHAEVEQEEPQLNNTRNKRQCPFYKKIPSTTITVDAFSYGVIPGCEAYVLTHFHYDHYGGLTKRFAQPIYCSQITGNLVEHRLGVHKKWINHLPLWKPCLVAGVTLTLMEANHCPGAVMILFELKDGRKIVHTGDFRACSDMEEYPMLQKVSTSELYLDTTYCDPSYTFPIQSQVINSAVSLALAHVAENPRTLIVCGTYTIGKEKIFIAIAKALNSKICVTRDKKKVLDCLDDRELQSRVTLDWSKGQVHVLPMGKLNQTALFEHHACHKQFQTVLAFEPTGWTYSSKTSLDNLRPKWSKNGVTLYGLPYSEHSSYLELKHFIQFLRPKKIIPTVNNGNPAARKKMEDTFAQWMRENLNNTKMYSASSHQHQTKLGDWKS